MTDLAVVGGTGLGSLEGLEITRRKVKNTPYGQASATLTYGTYAGKEIVFLPRHGHPHVIPPHRINYRANLHALREIGIQRVLSINAVGGITDRMTPCRIVLPDQIIDYTWGRKHSFYEEELGSVTHVDFTYPYAGPLRDTLVLAAGDIGLEVEVGATYGATQGPRLETAAEIRRLEQDGCDIVGMTGMPEAALARELGLDYASVAIVVNRAAGKADGEITMATIRDNLVAGIHSAQLLLEALIRRL